MARIVFEIDINAPAEAVVEALTTVDGIRGWWTDQVEFEGGEKGKGVTMLLRFAIAPMPFEVRIEEASTGLVAWSSVGDFPPHWVGTTITWTMTPTDVGAKVRFSHDGWANDEGPFPMSALTWAQLQATLKNFVETANPVPLFGSA